MMGEMLKRNSSIKYNIYNKRMEDSGKKQVSGKNGSRKIDSKLVTNYESRATQIDLDIQRIREDMK